MKKLYLLIFVILLAISAGFATLQQDLSEVEVTSTRVAGSVYMIHGTDDMKAFSGGNIGVSSGEDGVVMIDAKMAPLADKIMAVIRELGGDRPRFTINTHVHGDHVGGNAYFNQDGAVVAHTNIRKRMVTDNKAKEMWPVVTFDQSLSIHMNGEEIKILHYPDGHTDGDAIVFFKGSNVVHMGDHYFNKLFPFVDLNSGGSVQGYMKNVAKVLDEIPDDVKIIPGHGPLANKADLQNFLRMMKETTALITDGMKSGKSLDDLKAAGLPQEWKSWSWVFISTERWIETIYNSYPALTSQK